MKTNKSLPAWLVNQELYTPFPDTDSFLKKTLTRLVTLLRAFNPSTQENLPFKENPRQISAVTFLFILLVAISSKMVVLEFALTWLLVKLYFMPPQAIKKILKVSFYCFWLNLIIVLPSYFFLHNVHFWLIPVKLFLTVTAVQLFVRAISWHNFINTMRYVGIPHFFIFILHITLQYIYTLGRLAVTLFEALYLRSVGKNKKKNTSLGGVAGTLFIRVQDKITRLQEAMLCRGFDGTYHQSSKKSPWKLQDTVSVILIIIMGILTF